MQESRWQTNPIRKKSRVRENGESDKLFKVHNMQFKEPNVVSHFFKKIRKKQTIDTNVKIKKKKQKNL